MIPILYYSGQYPISKLDIALSCYIRSDFLVLK